MSWRDGTRHRTAKSLARYSIEEGFKGKANTKGSKEEKEIGTKSNKEEIETRSEDETPDETISPSPPPRMTRKRGKQENIVKEEPKKKKKRLRAPSPPLMRLPTSNRRKSNTSASTDYFMKELFGENKPKRSTRKKKQIRSLPSSSDEKSSSDSNSETEEAISEKESTEEVKKEEGLPRRRSTRRKNIPKPAVESSSSKEEEEIESESESNSDSENDSSEESSSKSEEQSDRSEDENFDAGNSFTCITKNIFVGVKKTKDEITESCNCLPFPDIPGLSCGTNCMNRIALEECHPDTCPCGDCCLNQRFQKSQYCKLKLARAEKKGHGLYAEEDIPSGTFIIEYLGEVIDHDRLTKRMDKMGSEKHFYVIGIGKNLYIDATKKGSLGRFINHSCEPNCQPEIWNVLGQKCVGIFAYKDIKHGEELTFDYKFQRMGKKKQRCYCGTALCRGFLGSPPTPPEPKPPKNPNKRPKRKVKKKEIFSPKVEKKPFKRKPPKDRRRRQISPSSSPIRSRSPSLSPTPPFSILEDGSFSIRSMLPLVIQFDDNNIPDKTRIRAKNLFLIRNINKKRLYKFNK